jgi:hypothetical protein
MEKKEWRGTTVKRYIRAGRESGEEENTVSEGKVEAG